MLQPPNAPPTGLIGGYRLLRPLGTGPRATVHLGYAEGHPHAAVKEYAAAVPAERIELEAAALMRAAGAHVVRLDDLALDARGRPALLLERVPGPSLGALLDRRGLLRPGEAVTILAPIAETLARMHRLGVVHGGIDAASVVFSAEGAPTLVGFGDAELVDPAATGAEAVRRRTELLSRDALALHRLAVGVLDATATPDAGSGSPERADALQVAALRAVAEAEPLHYPARLADTMFDQAEPEPVDLDGDGPSRREVPGRVSAPDRAPVPDAGRLAFDALPLPEWLRTAGEGMLADALRRLGAVRDAAGTVRRRFWVAGSAAALALTLALAVVPGGPGDRSPSPQAPPTIAPVAGSPSAAPVAAAGPGQAAVSGEDPAAAALVLLAAREECFRELSVLCLDWVDQPGSSAAQADEAAILAAQAAGGMAADGVRFDGVAEVLERLGDTAIVRITAPDAEPASVLVIRTEAGWRIRGFPGAPRGGARSD